MTNQYTGRSLNEIYELCQAEYRFYRNSLRNFRPADVADMGEYLNDGNTSPKQSLCLGMPAMCIDHDTANFAFPVGFDDVMGSEDEFTIEYCGVVQDRYIENTYIALIGESGSANPYIGLRDDNRVELNFGTQIISDQISWWWKDSLIHFVVTREAGATGDSFAYINGSEVSFASQAAGNGGFSDAAGDIFNHTDDTGGEHPWWGHHFLLRQYSEQLVKAEVLELYQDVQRLFPHHLFHIPIYQSA